MGGRGAPYTSTNMFHVIIKSYLHQTPFQQTSIAEMCARNLFRDHGEKKIFIRAFCIMPDHVHLCGEPIGMNIEKYCSGWKSLTTHQAWKLGWNGKLWQPGFCIKNIPTEKSQETTIQYVLRNPERAGLVKNWKEWKYSAQPFIGPFNWHPEAAPGLAQEINPTS
jgi:REP element-mobilizing transposase RayT